MRGDDAPAPGHRRHPQPSSWAAIVAAAVYGWWAVGLEPFSWEAALAVLAPGVVVALVSARWTRPRGDAAARPVMRRDLGAWVALAFVAGAWQLAAYVQHPREDHPTISSLTNAALDTHGARTAAFVLWLLVIVALVRR